jgi:fission 1 protein
MQKRYVSILSGNIQLEIMAISEKYRRECLYYIAVGHFRLEEYPKSREYIDALIAAEPHNQQAKSMKLLIDNRVSREGMIGMAIIGGITIAATSALAIALFRKRS